MSLRPCASCARLVREDRCPFCAAELAPAPVASILARGSRAALFATALGVSSLATACHEQGPVAMYGGPPMDTRDAAPAPTESASAVPTATASATVPQGPVTAYGGPPITTVTPPPSTTAPLTPKAPH